MDVKGTRASCVITVLIFAKGHYEQYSQKLEMFRFPTERSVSFICHKKIIYQQFQNWCFFNPSLKNQKKKTRSHLFYLNSTYSSFSSFRMPIAFAYPSSEHLILTFQFFFFWKKWTVLCLCSHAMGIAQGKWHISATKYNTTDIISIFSKRALQFWQHPQGLLLYISLS